MLFHGPNRTNISEKYSPLYVLMSFQNYLGFFRTSTFHDVMKDSEIYLENCLLIYTCSFLGAKRSMGSLLVRVVTPGAGGQWIDSP